MRHYPNTAKEFAARIGARYPDAEMMSVVDTKILAQGVAGESKWHPAYLLWMMRELQTFDDERKIGSWMGWVVRFMEVLGLANNQECRDLMRSDKPPTK